MGRYSFGGSAVIQPTKPYLAEIFQASAVSGTYYTLVDVTSSPGGILTFVGGVAESAYNDKFKVRITVDGGTPLILAPTSLNGNMAVGMYLATTTGGGGDKNVKYILYTTFKSTLKVEVMQDSGNNAWLAANAVYQLV